MTTKGTDWKAETSIAQYERDWYKERLEWVVAQLEGIIGVRRPGPWIEDILKEIGTLPERETAGPQRSTKRVSRKVKADFQVK